MFLRQRGDYKTDGDSTLNTTTHDIYTDTHTHTHKHRKRRKGEIVIMKEYWAKDY